MTRPQEGEQCSAECTGTLEYLPVTNCTCHRSPPCGACTENPLVCTECGWSSDD